jgi:hypothetical protein
VIRADDPDAPVLEPKLTAHDQRVLGLLPVLSTVVHGRWTGRSAWEDVGDQALGGVAA